MQSKSPNSRIVTLYRKESFIMGAQVGKAPDFVAQSKQSIGSFWYSSDSKTQGSGLDFEEQKLLMPLIVDCEPTDRNFRAKVAEYFASIKTVIPYGKGKSLEIGLEKSNKEPLSQDNQPLDVYDYITYRHAIAHPLVAATKQEADRNMLKQFYIFDPQAAEDREVKENTSKDAALEQYLLIKKTPEKVDMLLTLLLQDPRTFTGKNADALKIEKLKELAQSNPAKFVSTFKDKFFEELYVIKTMVNTGVLNRVGENIIDIDTGETIGHTSQEAVAWFRDKANSERVVILKAKMQEAMTKPVSATSKAR